jgi:hypothetical protein
LARKLGARQLPSQPERRILRLGWTAGHDGFRVPANHKNKV